MPDPIVIVGANLAGGSAAATLRDEGYDGPLVLIGEEPHPPYERPPLSKEYLRGEQDFEQTLVRPPGFYAQQDITTRFGTRVARLHPDERGVELADGQRLRCRAVLLATGGRNRRPPIPGLDLEGVHDLRTVADADRIRREIRPGARAVVVGMGFIGCEVAASLRSRGMEVTAVESLATPLLGVLGGRIGEVVAQLHRDHRVELVLGEAVEAFEGPGRVERVVTETGRRLECDVAVVGLGIAPVTDPVEGTAVAVDNGIVVDEYCRSTVPSVYAAGDVANHYHPLVDRHVRVEHWQNALRQGAAAARSMLGRGRPYDDVHWFWSDQYDTNIQYAGFPTVWDRLVIRGTLEERRFVAFYLNEGRLVAAVGVNRPRDVRLALRLIEGRARTAADRLADPDVGLRDLVLEARSRAS